MWEEALERLKEENHLHNNQFEATMSRLTTQIARLVEAVRNEEADTLSLHSEKQPMEETIRNFVYEVPNEDSKSELQFKKQPKFFCT